MGRWPGSRGVERKESAHPTRAAIGLHAWRARESQCESRWGACRRLRQFRKLRRPNSIHWLVPRWARKNTPEENCQRRHIERKEDGSDLNSPGQVLPHPPKLRLTPRDSWHAPCTPCSRSAHATVGRGEVAQSGTGETTTAANKWPKDVAAGVRAYYLLQSLVPRENF